LYTYKEEKTHNVPDVDDDEKFLPIIRDVVVFSLVVQREKNARRQNHQRDLRFLLGNASRSVIPKPRVRGARARVILGSRCHIL
jgi:hypothetical protein